MTRRKNAIPQPIEHGGLLIEAASSSHSIPTSSSIRRGPSPVARRFGALASLSNLNPISTRARVLAGTAPAAEAGCLARFSFLQLSIPAAAGLRPLAAFYRAPEI